MNRRKKNQLSLFYLNIFGQKFTVSPAESYLMRSMLVFRDIDITGGSYDVLGKIHLILGKFLYT